jgi:hypothetical protein
MEVRESAYTGPAPSLSARDTGGGAMPGCACDAGEGTPQGDGDESP